MLELLEPTTVKLSNVQSRVEKHGDDDCLAIDLAVTWNTNNRNLTSIQKQLRNMLFCDLRQETGSDQAEMDLPVDELPNVRVPGLNYPVALDFQQVGARVEVAYGIDDTTAIVLHLAKIHKVRVTPIEGGSAEVKFAISSSADIDDHIIGTLSVLQQREISLKLTMPEVEQPAKPLTESDVFSTVVPDEQKAPLTAEDVFIGTASANDGVGNATEFASSVEKAVVKATRKGKKG
jgi:hypothetical protein